MTTNNPNVIENKIPSFIKETIMRQIGLETEKLIEEATEKLKKRIPEIVARTTIEIMKMVDMQTMSDRVVFTIRNSDNK